MTFLSTMTALDYLEMATTRDSHNSKMKTNWLDYFKTLLSDNQRSNHFVDGLPEPVHDESFHEVVKEFAHDEPASTSYQHLSGWKSTGAFRIRVKLRRGCIWTVIFKDANYNLEQIPALEGLSILPGPPEYWIYKSGGIGLKKFLPNVYTCMKHPNKLHFHYFLEDLQPLFGPVSGEDIMQVCRFLPLLHDDMTNIIKRTTHDKLINYDLNFSTSLLRYVFEGLNLLDRIDRSSSSILNLPNWNNLEDLYLSNMEFAYSQARPHVIHGDSNKTNILISRSKEREVRFIDWEWAGIGLPHMDLASFLKNVSPQMEGPAVRSFSQNYLDSGKGADMRIYLWCKLQRALFDAGFFAKQEFFQAQHKQGALDEHIGRACKRASEAVVALSNLE